MLKRIWDGMFHSRHPQLGRLYVYEAAQGLRVHLLPVENGTGGKLKDASVTYVFGPERTAAELYQQLHVCDLALPPVLLPQAVFSDGSLSLAEARGRNEAWLFQHHWFYDPAAGKSFDIHGAELKDVAGYSALLRVLNLPQLASEIVAARQRMLSNKCEGITLADLGVEGSGALPPETFFNDKRLWVVASLPDSEDLMDDPNLDISTIEETLMVELERAGVGELDGNGFGEGRIELFLIANPGKYPQVLQLLRGTLTALGVKQFVIAVSNFDD